MNMSILSDSCIPTMVRHSHPSPRFEITPAEERISVRVWGRTLPELFSHALEGMAHCLAPAALGSSKRIKKVRLRITAEAVDINSLLIEFLSRALTHATMSGAVFTSARFVTLGDNFLEGEIAGIPAAGAEREIRAVSYEGVDVRKNRDSGLYEAALTFEV